MISLDGIKFVSHDEAFLLLARDHPRQGKYLTELLDGKTIAISTSGA
jgi:hypothetical protein